MTNIDLDIPAAEQLRNFAVSHGEMQFAHMVSAAVNGELWAVERVNKALLKIGYLSGARDCEQYLEAKIEIVRSANTDKPNGSS